MLRKLKNSYPNQSGVATLLVTVLLLVTITFIVLFAASYGMLQQKVVSNQLRSNQAYQAAEAGLEFGIPYLQANSTTILANPDNGFIHPFSNSLTSNVTLANNSRYTITYSNPIANNYNLILISVTGTSDDASTTRTLSQRVQFGSLLQDPPELSLTTQGSVALGGNANVSNLTGGSTIQSASGITFSGNGATTTATGGSYAGHIEGDIQQNNSSLQGMTQEEFFKSIFGASINTVRSNATNLYSNSSDTNYSSSLNGKTGTTIWIDQTGGTATINGNTTIGSASNPVLLVVNGNLDISGNVTIYGFIFVLGATSYSTDITGNVSLNGGLVTTDNLNMSGNTSVAYNSSVLTTVQQLPSLIYYAKVPGTWKDF